MALPSPIYLSGFMAAGKTTIGKLLAAKLGRRFVDTDALIEKRVGQKIATIFSKKGEDFFRRWETRVLKELAQQRNIVVSLGGGAVILPLNRALLRRGQWLHLETPWPLIAARLKKNKNRPLAKGKFDQIFTLWQSRQRYYALAPRRIYCQGLRAHALADQIARIVS